MVGGKALNKGKLLKERYRTDEVLGEGAHGTVYRVTDLSMGEICWAVKEIREESLPLDERADIVAHFYREAEILRKLNHTGLPKVVEAFSDGNHHYMVMEHVEGRTLRDVLNEGLPEKQNVLAWALSLCDILLYIHSQKPSPLIFRDLKPSNIMVTSRNRLLLIDFGIARYYNPEKSSDTTPLGTPGYAAPESYGTAQTDARSDIYSLGATLFELLSGADLTTFNFVFPPLSRINSTVGPALEGIVARCLELSPESRYQSAAEVRDALMPLYRKKKHSATSLKKPQQNQPEPVLSSSKPVHSISIAAASPSKRSALVPLPDSMRLWNSPVSRPPLRVPFVPAWLLHILEDQSDVIRKAPGLLFILISLCSFCLSYEIRGGGCFSLIFFVIILAIGILAIPALLICRLYFHIFWVILALAMDYGLYWIVTSHHYGLGVLH